MIDAKPPHGTDLPRGSPSDSVPSRLSLNCRWAEDELHQNIPMHIPSTAIMVDMNSVIDPVSSISDNNQAIFENLACALIKQAL